MGPSPAAMPWWPVPPATASTRVPVANDIQRLAWEAFNLGGKDAGIIVEVINRAFVDVAAHKSSVFADRLAEITAAQARTLIGTASNGLSPIFSAAFARSVGLASRASVKRESEALDTPRLLVNRPGSVEQQPTTESRRARTVGSEPSRANTMDFTRHSLALSYVDLRYYRPWQATKLCSAPAPASP